MKFRQESAHGNLSEIGIRDSNVNRFLTHFGQPTVPICASTRDLQIHDPQESP